MSILRLGDRQAYRGAKMTTDPVVMDVSQDWATACDVQERFMQHPGPTIDGLSYSARCRQVRALGGDCYDFLPLPHNRLALAIGDASGKSLAAALMISSVQSSLRTAASFAGSDAAAVLRAVNSQAYASSLAGRYATLFYGVFDGTMRTLRYVNAGHNPPIVIRQDRSMIRLQTGGVPVGIFPSWPYEEGLVQLGAGDLIIAYTDGVTEALNPAGEEWGVEGLRKAADKSAAQCADGIACALFTSMDEFSLGRQTDDAAVIVARVN
jgi:sigma-B regulation protein RsbU (phosphoserine phosphatase)